MKTSTLILTFLFAGLLKAQQSELINNTWYLQKIINSIGIETPAPNNSEVSNIPAMFNQTNMQTDVVTSFLGWIFPGSSQPITNTTINYDEYQYAPNYPNCIIPENCTFQNNYFFFFGYGFPMSYQITNESNYLKLTLTNNSGNKAVYYSQVLSVNETDKENFNIFPNPVKNILNISTKSFTELIIQLYDLQGKLVLSKKIKKSPKLNNFELDMNNLNKGIYFLTINNEYKTKIFKE